MIVGQRNNHWEIVDVQRRRVICRCRCGAVHAIGIDALESGSAAPSCGCVPLPAQQRPGRRGGNGGKAKQQKTRLTAGSFVTKTVNEFRLDAVP
jgi:hypothetical protein